MLRYAQWVLIPAVLFGWLLAAGPATAQKKRPEPARKVQDEAGLFSPAAIEKANAEIAEIKRLYHKDFLIETFPSAPEAIKNIDLKNKRAEAEFFENWARRRADSDLVNGVYLLICKNPKWVEPVVGQETRQSGMFTVQNRNELGRIVREKLHAGQPDQALLQTVNYVRDTFRAQAPAVARAPTAAPVAPKANVPAPVHRGQMGNEDGHSNILAWVCLAVAAVLVIWLIFGMIRAFTAPRGGYMGGPGGGPGYAGGGGYGGGGGGFGGGGFMSGLLGGMFGAVAGNWLYNNIGGGGHTGGGWGASGAQAADPGQPDAGTDVGGDYSAGGGGDYGDAGGDQGGGDAGGGGDWGGGGGGDTGGGGGGDWGGGGGDTGGGGGGDWGGGGGGDFGGGGGGGGDW